MSYFKLEIDDIVEMNGKPGSRDLISMRGQGYAIIMRPQEPETEREESEELDEYGYPIYPFVYDEDKIDMEPDKIFDEPGEESNEISEWVDDVKSLCKCNLVFEKEETERDGSYGYKAYIAAPADFFSFLIKKDFEKHKEAFEKECEKIDKTSKLDIPDGWTDLTWRAQLKIRSEMHHSSDCYGGDFEHAQKLIDDYKKRNDSCYVMFDSHVLERDIELVKSEFKTLIEEYKLEKERELKEKEEKDRFFDKVTIKGLFKGFGRE